MASTNSLTNQFNQLSSLLPGGSLGVVRNAMNGIKKTVETFMPGMSAIALKGASQGGVSLAPDTIVNAETGALVRMPAAPQYTAVPTNQRDRGAPSMNTRILNSEQGNTASGSPEFRKGYGQVGYGGQVFDIPNAVLQQVMNDHNQNRGRYSPDDYFVGNPSSDPSLIFENFDVARQKLAKYRQENQQFEGSGTLNPYQDAVEKSVQAESALSRIPKTQTEKFDVTGKMIGGDASAWNKQAQQLQKDVSSAASQANQYQSRGAKLQAQQASQGATQKAYDDLNKIFTPTKSNLQIKETLI